MKTIFYYSELQEAIEEMVEKLDYQSGYKVELYFWEDETISSSGIMSKNSSIIWKVNPIFTYYNECEKIDEDLTEEEALEIQKRYQDYILADIVNKIEEENLYSENKIIINYYL